MRAPAHKPGMFGLNVRKSEPCEAHRKFSSWSEHPAWCAGKVPDLTGGIGDVGGFYDWSEYPVPCRASGLQKGRPNV